MANKIYGAIETSFNFASSGATGATITPTSVANGAGRLSARYDRGATSKPTLYRWVCRFKTAAAAAVGRQLRLYAITAEASTGSTYTDGAFSESDQGVSSEDLYRNGVSVGMVQCDQATVGPFVGSGYVELRGRYVQIGFFNDTGQSMSATASDFELLLIPVPDDIQ